MLQVELLRPLLPWSKLNLVVTIWLLLDGTLHSCSQR